MKLNSFAKFSLLSISILLMSHLAISPVIPNLYKFYHESNPNIGLASVESLATIPAMMITIFVLLSNGVIKFIGKKNTVLLGLLLIFIFGIVPAFTTNFKVVLISRLFLGAGIGLFNSLSISMISDFFDEEHRGTMIGLRTAFLNIGKALTTFISGYLLIYGIQYTFLVYALALPIFIIFLLFVPNAENVNNKKVSIKFHKETIVLTLLTFLVGISYMGATIKIPTLLAEKYHYQPDVSRNLLTILALSGILSGVIFGILVKRFKNLTLPIMLSFMTIGSGLFALTNNIVIFYIAAIFIGISFVGTMSFNFFYISKKLENKFINFATSIILVGGNIGVILTPVVLTKIPEALYLEKYTTPFFITTTLMLTSTLVSYAILRNKK
ncbi:MFS transporter [Gemella sp. 20925_1_85]|uniref:MFS transporter n=1 Tax=Gemella sp. 20925_1_85 TaxID=3003690 RepID=UPI0025D71874|nr:MFS transporter [uncultured Gemella sp.]